MGVGTLLFLLFFLPGTTSVIVSPQNWRAQNFSSCTGEADDDAHLAFGRPQLTANAWRRRARGRRRRRTTSTEPAAHAPRSSAPRAPFSRSAAGVVEVGLLKPAGPPARLRSRRRMACRPGRPTRRRNGTHFRLQFSFSRHFSFFCSAANLKHPNVHLHSAKISPAITLPPLPAAAAARVGAALAVVRVGGGGLLCLRHKVREIRSLFLPLLLARSLWGNLEGSFLAEEDGLSAGERTKR